MEIIGIWTSRDTYSAEESARDSITIGELIRELENYDEDAKVVFVNDNGYTYGRISTRGINDITE